MHQNQDIVQGLHRRGALAKRQRVVITTTITRAHTTATLTATVIQRPVTTTSDAPATPVKVTPTPSKVDKKPVTTSSILPVVPPPSTTIAVVTSTTPPAITTSTTPTITTSSSSSTTKSVPRVVTTVTKIRSAVPSSTAVGSTAKTTGPSTGTVIGIVAGVIGGLLVLAILVGFVVRRFRRRAADREAWSASKFRRSAIVLDEPKEPPSNNPRPPSMIERHVANHVPSAPSAAYPYTDAVPQFGNEGNYGQPFDGGANRQFGSPAPYGAPNPYGAPPVPYSGQNMYNQFPDQNHGSGYGAAAGVGAYGAPAPYSSQQQRHPQQQFNSGYPNFNGQPQRQQQQQQQQYSGFASGQVMSNANPARSDSVHSHGPNPFSEPPVHQQAPSVSSHEHGSASSSSASPPPHRAPTPPEKASFLTRQPTQVGGAPPAYEDDGSYANLKRDAKTPVVMTVDGTAKGPSSAPAPPPATSAAPAAPAATSARIRPLSSYTVYDPDDAYGGI